MISVLTNNRFPGSLSRSLQRFPCPRGRRWPLLSDIGFDFFERAEKPLPRNGTPDYRISRGTIAVLCLPRCSKKYPITRRGVVRFNYNPRQVGKQKGETSREKDDRSSKWNKTESVERESREKNRFSSSYVKAKVFLCREVVTTLIRDLTG